MAARPRVELGQVVSLDGLAIRCDTVTPPRLGVEDGSRTRMSMLTVVFETTVYTVPPLPLYLNSLIDSLIAASIKLATITDNPITNPTG